MWGRRDMRAAQLVALLLAYVPAIGAAQTIPSDRTFLDSWQAAGYPGDVPAPVAIVNVKDVGAVGDGVTDDYPAVSGAIASVGGHGGVVYFPAGVYLLNSRISLPGGVVLRGQRSETTCLKFDVTGHCITVLGAAYVYQPVLSGYTNRSSAIEVSDGNEFTAGDYAQIREESDPAWGMSSWADYAPGQIVRITSVASNTLSVDNSLRLEFKAAWNPEIRRIVPATNAGIENLKIERVLNGDIPNLYTVYFLLAARCWVRGVESYNGFGAHIGIVVATQIEVSGCYFHHAHSYGGGGSGYGIKIQAHSGECLTENNIFSHLRHAMLLQYGANGNVFGYNYSREPTRTEWPSDYGADISCHGNYPFANLFEGNVCQNLQVDASHGANGPHNTFFRNRVDNYGIVISENRSDSQNLVGNEITGTSAFHGLYTLQASGHFEYGNNSANDGIIPPGTGDLSDCSYYLGPNPAQAPPEPDFWTLAEPIPTIGPTNALSPVGTIPAEQRYLSATNLTVGPPSLAAQPEDQTVDAGQAASFSVTAFGTPVARYSWRKDGVPLAGRTNSTLSLPSVRGHDEGAYDVIVFDDCGMVQSAAAILDVADETGRGVPESWYAEHGLTNGDPDALDLIDSDGDGVLNWKEYGADTTPTNSDSVLALTAIGQEIEGIRVEWKGGVQATQFVEWRADLTDRNYGWRTIFTNHPMTEISNTVVDTAGSDKALFYRIRTER